MHVNTLIVGAGPAGLATALTLAIHGRTDVKIIDRRDHVSDSTKAIVLWAGAMQVLDYLGVYDRVAAQAIPMPATSYILPTGSRRSVSLKAYGSGFPYPALSVPQPVIEQALESALSELGVTVERGVDVNSVSRLADGVDVSTSTGAISARWVVGADGAHSVVRDSVGITFDGQALEDYFFLVDGVPKHPAEAGARYFLDSPESTVVAVPLPEGRARVFVRQGSQAPSLSAETINSYLSRTGHSDLLMVTIEWASEFRVAERQAAALRTGRVVLAGDAAHIHSPAGGQGLNAGIQDGHMLGTALARGAADDASMDGELDDYARRRHAAAGSAIATTQQQLRIWTARTPAQKALRRLSLRALTLSRRLQGAVLQKTAQQNALQIGAQRSEALHDLTDDLREAISIVASSGLDDTVLIPAGTVHRSAKAGVRVVETPHLRDGISAVVVGPDLTVWDVK